MSEPHPKAVIVGAGVAGATVALELRAAGYDVTVVEREAACGGRVARFGCKATSECQHCHVCTGQDQIRRAFSADSGIELLSGMAVTALVPGWNGAPHTADLAPTSGAGEASRVAADVVVLCTGYKPYCAEQNWPYGYGKIPNVITGLDLEQSLVGGRRALCRPSDSAPARSVAFIQCVGSRSEVPGRTPEATGYCSAVCCAYALRSARLLQDLGDEVDVTVYHMDLQFSGRDFPGLYRHCSESCRIVRARPYALEQAEGDQVAVVYEDQASCRVSRDVFDVVVLSIGIRPDGQTRALADAARVSVDDYGFFAVQGGFGATRLPGLHVAGTCTGPKDIPTTVTHAKSVAHSIIAACESGVPAS